MTPIRSMTGYARARRTAAAAEVTAAVKSVNHRGLDVRFHMASELDPFETALRAAVKLRVVRGHLEVRLSVERLAAAAPLAVNHALLSAYVAAFRQASAEHGIPGEPDLNAAFRLPGILGDAAGTEPQAEIEQVVVETVEEALEALNRFREREGAELAGLLRGLAARIEEHAAAIERERVLALPALEARLSERLKELLQGAGIDPQRLAQEAAILADRSDIAEEIARLRIHARQVADLLEQGGEAGRKLDFMSQEMHREANTILSKTAGVGEAGLRITELALAAKSDIDKIREQSLNLE